MLLIGSDDGVYTQFDGHTEQTLDAGRVHRLRTFDGVSGAFAATQGGLYHTDNGTEWRELCVPHERTNAVTVNPDANELLVGTSPAHIFRASLSSIDPPSPPTWTELDGFQQLPSRDDWCLPRHENRAHVREILADPAGENWLVAGVEVGGIHCSTDGGRSWVERSNGVDPDIHELTVTGPAEYVAATGHGLYRTRDAGQTWKRLDQNVRQSYFRSVYSIGDNVYAAGALSNSSDWDDPDADPGLFVATNAGSLDPLSIPATDEMVTGMTAIEGELYVATHHGRLFAHRGSWNDVGEFPVRGPLTGRYTPVAALDA
ncbi:beta propeller repeat protein [Halocatena halophila]|uniref:hypothetical protein n=1 Tax=Halocatena halophila TaxID=2814576 RepID=UPI002ED12D2B